MTFARRAKKDLRPNRQTIWTDDYRTWTDYTGTVRRM